MQPDIAETLRYLGVRGAPDEALRRDVEQAAAALAEQVQPQYTYRVFPAVPGPDGIVLAGAGMTLPGETAAKMLAECGRAALLLCTLGAPFETLLRACQARSMARAVVLDACGSALVEAGCAAAEREIAERFPGCWLTDRFSPGYGDLPLALQTSLCAALDAGRRLGVSVTESLLLNPTKTVTAVIGLAETPQAARIRGCGACALGDACAYRKGGGTCAV